MAVLDGKDGKMLWTLNSTYAGMMSGLSVISDTRGQDAALFLVSGQQESEPDPNLGGRGDTQTDSGFRFQSNDQFDSRLQYQNDYQTDPNSRWPDYRDQQVDPSSRRPGYKDNTQTDSRYQLHTNQQADSGSRWSDYHGDSQSDTRFQSSPPATKWPQHTDPLGMEGDTPPATKWPQHTDPLGMEGDTPRQEQSHKQPRSLKLHFPLPREHPQCTHMFFEGPGSPVCRWYEWFSDGQETYIREKRHGGMGDGPGSFNTAAEPPVVWSQMPGVEFPDPDADLDAFLRYCGHSVKQLTAYLYLMTRGLAEGGDVRPLAQHEPYVYSELQSHSVVLSSQILCDSVSGYIMTLLQALLYQRISGMHTCRYM